MNLLAHLLLGSHLSPTSAAGNLTADFCREDGSAAFNEGVLVHRHIDRFTDNSSEVARARLLFSPELARFSSILIDLAFDYCLAYTWEEWSPQISRSTFIDQQLAEMMHVSNGLPHTSCVALHTIIDERWLHGYHEVSGINAAIERIVKRKPRFRPMLEATPLIELHFSKLRCHFAEFYPQLETSVRQMNA